MKRIVYSIAILLVGSYAGVASAGDPLPVKTVEHQADSVGRKMKYNIVLPDDYERSNERYPVLYLLHGLTSNYTAWAFMKVPEVAADYKLIIVMPDVGNSWYVNWAESESGQKNNWENYIIKDLIGHVDQNYRTLAKREGARDQWTVDGGLRVADPRVKASGDVLLDRQSQRCGGFCTARQNRLPRESWPSFSAESGKERRTPRSRSKVSAAPPSGHRKERYLPPKSSATRTTRSSWCYRSIVPSCRTFT